MIPYKIEDIAARIATKHNVAFAEGMKRVKDVLDEIKTAAREQDVELKGFGRFYILRRQPRPVVAQGLTYLTRASETLAFKASKQLKRFEKRE